jgi:hypothetical protein
MFTGHGCTGCIGAQEANEPDSGCIGGISVQETGGTGGRMYVTGGTHVQETGFTFYIRQDVHDAVCTRGISVQEAGCT